MNLEETVTLWETEYNELVRIMRAHKSDEYKLGFTDGMETAVEIPAHLHQRIRYVD